MKSGKKTSGGRYLNPKKKRKDARNRQDRIVKIGEQKTKVIRTKGGNRKQTAHTLDKANVVKDKKAKVVGIKNVLETPSNTFLARQNILVKGAIIETELGKARITNRPSQEGLVQAVLIKE
ncbi:30S ribosomal protein S8e [Candidatus Pacearchaeota archaeon]|jgi:small subunit ribosomal protein S8e|nr:30S ribosomal protein S8e [Candidatus Pacearchaeota archaeon]|tara:strand:- start:15603 stop:15965 length:363 start_codon:yes stop_codon:yes gene_type:complete